MDEMIFLTQKPVQRCSKLSMKQLLLSIPKEKKLLFVCIGSVNSIGDSVGPRIGHHLQKSQHKAMVIGSLYEPIHALTLSDAASFIEKQGPDTYVIAIDACLSKKKANVGKISISSKPLKPGAGLKKDLGEIGHAYVSVFVGLDYDDAEKNHKELAEVNYQTAGDLAIRVADYLANCIKKYR